MTIPYGIYNTKCIFYICACVVKCGGPEGLQKTKPCGIYCYYYYYYYFVKLRIYFSNGIMLMMMVMMMCLRHLNTISVCMRACGVKCLCGHCGQWSVKRALRGCSLFYYISLSNVFFSQDLLITYSSRSLNFIINKEYYLGKNNILIKRRTIYSVFFFCSI